MVEQSDFMKYLDGEKENSGLIEILEGLDGNVNCQDVEGFDALSFQLEWSDSDLKAEPLYS